MQLQQPDPMPNLSWRNGKTSLLDLLCSDEPFDFEK